MTFWETFYTLCESHGTKPNAVAKKLGFSSAICTQWKKGLQKPSAEKLSKIAAYFGVSIEYLLGSDQPSAVEDVKNSIKNESSPTSAAREALHKKLESMSLDELREVDQFMDFLLSKEK